MGEEEADLDPWNGQGVRLKAFEEDEKATTVSHAKARLEQRTQQQSEPDEDETKSSDPSQEQLTPDLETDALCTQLRHALDRVRMFECEIEDDDDAENRVDRIAENQVPSEPLEPRRRRRTRALRRRSASPASTTSSSTMSEHAVCRTQHELSHARADRLQRQRQRPAKVDAALAKRQRSLNRSTRPLSDFAVNTSTLEARIRQRAFSLDGQTRWASLPVQRRSSNGDFVIRRYNAYLEDPDELQVPAVNWQTIRMAREKCTEWLVKHVLLPDGIPRLRNSKPRIA